MLIPVDITYPKMALVEQHIDTPRVADVPAAIRAEMARLGVSAKVRPGMRIAITAGSRGITGIPMILATVVGELTGLCINNRKLVCCGVCDLLDLHSSWKNDDVMRFACSKQARVLPL